MSDFPATWELRPLEECMDAIIDYRGKTPKKSDSGIPLLSAKVIKAGRILDEIFEFIPSEDYVSWMRRGLPQPGDIVMTTEGPLGEIAQLDNRKYALGQRIVTLRGKAGVLDNNYLKYLMQSEFVQSQLRARATGTTVLGIKQSELRLINLILPPIAEQKAIGNFLRSLDDKIELNRRMNATLEAIARAIFKSWFVDFDPVRAKAEGRQPEGMDAETAALFPDAFEESELGLIPKGWTVQALAEHVKAVKGLSYKGSGLTDFDGGMPMHNLNSVYEGGGYKYDGIKHYSGEYQERHIARAGDLIVTNTEQGHNMLLIGYPALIPNRYPVGLFSHHIFRVTPLEHSHITPRFLYFLMRTDFFHAVIGGYTNGTTVNILSVDGLQRPLFVVPPSELVARFDQIIMPILEKMEVNHEETERLAETRDALLPKLISGQIRVNESV